MSGSTGGGRTKNAEFAMFKHMIDRRLLLGQAMGAALASALAEMLPASALAQDAPPAPPPTPPPPPFTPDIVAAEAKRLSESAFVAPKIDLPEPFNKLSYDQYRDIRFRPERAIWKGEGLHFELQPFAMGWLYEAPTDLWLVENGAATKLVADGRLFSLGPLIGQGPEAAPFGFSGFRIHSPINRADYFDEFVVFQGASYLRAVGRGEGYGASARGLAINTARPGGEEFPMFRSFWIERPAHQSQAIVVHALLDSQSTTGAFRFTIAPGETTVMDVEATLFPRREIEHFGIAPLTSMFLHGPASQRRLNDFRPSVHDSEGLAIINGSGERLWRPLINPRTLQTSAFIDNKPQGFGLWQRDRSFDNYEDLEARYERRPSIWVEPKGEWGEGYIELIEIPVEDEIHDNVVAYWKPKTPLAAGQPLTYAYRLHWGASVPASWAGSRVAKTRVGNSKKPDTLLFVIDVEGDAVRNPRDLPMAEVSASPGEIANVVVQRNPEISGVRVTFELLPGSNEVIELRLVLKAEDKPISETWLYRWTKP